MAVKAAVCRAEGITSSGLSFPVDALVVVSESDVSVRLGGKETVIRRTDLESFVVSETLGERALSSRLDANALLRFAEQSFSKGQHIYAGLAYRALRWRPEMNEEQILESLDVVSESASTPLGLATMARNALLPVFEPERFPRVTARLVISAGVDDPAWVRQYAVPYSYAIKRSIQDRLERELVVRLRLRDLEQGARLVRFASEVYGADDPLAQRTAVWLDRVRGLVKAADGGDIDALGKALAVEASNPELGAILAPVAMEGLHKAATGALAQSDPERALDILARVDLLKRSQTTHELTRTALERLAARRGSVLERPDSLNYLDFIARNDPQLAELYREKLLAQISLLLNEGAVSESESLLERAKLIPSATSPAFERILVRQAEVYLSQGLHGIAARKLRESGASGPAVLWLRFRLSIAMMSAPTLGVILAIFFALAALVGLSIVRGARRHVSSAEHKQPMGRGVSQASPLQGGDSEPGADVGEEDADAPRGFVVNELRRLSPSAQEYQRCLEALGLTANADLRAIKNAYRKLVKDVHPDRNKTNDEVAANRFIELTRMYDRILELRREFGYHD